MPDNTYFERPDFGKSGNAHEQVYSPFALENNLVSALAMNAGEQRRHVGPGDFEKTFGAGVAGELKRIGCKQVSIDGDTVSLTLADTHFEAVNQGGIGRVRLAENMSFKIEKGAQDIKISNITGVDLDFGALAPWMGVPDLVLTKGNVEVVLPIKNVNLGVDDDVYTQVGAVARSLSPVVKGT